MRMGNDSPAKKVLKRFARVGGKRERGRPSLHWHNEVEEAVTKHGVGSWTMLAHIRSAVKVLLRQAETQ